MTDLATVDHSEDMTQLATILSSRDRTASIPTGFLGDMGQSFSAISTALASSGSTVLAGVEPKGKFNL